jgi:DNA-binding MarR family transcriptional regulator
VRVLWALLGWRPWFSSRSVVHRRDPLVFLESYASLKRCLDAVCTETYAASEFSALEAKILRYVAENPGTSQADLARATSTDAALTGRALQPLLDKGWIERRRSDEDRREYVLSLATPGRSPLKRAHQVRGKLAARLVEHLDERDLQDFDRIVEKLRTVQQTPLPVKPVVKPRRR